MKEQKRSQKSLQSSRKSLLDSKDGSLQLPKKDSSGLIKVNPKKRLMLSDLLIGRSTQGTDETEGVAQSKAAGFCTGNKNLRQNLNNIFKGTGNSKHEVGYLDKKNQFKIGRSQEGTNLRVSNASLGGSSKALSKDGSRMKTDNSLQRDASKKSTKTPQIEKKRVERPPIPKTKRPITQNNEFYFSQEDFTKPPAFKVNVNVEITSTRPSIECQKSGLGVQRAPPKAPVSKRTEPQIQDPTAKQTNLVRQKASSQADLVLPQIPTRNAKISHPTERSNQSEMSLGHLERKAPPQAREKKSRIHVKKSQTESSEIEVYQETVFSVSHLNHQVNNPKHEMPISPTDKLLIEHEKFLLSRKTPAQARGQRRASADPEVSNSKLSTPCLLLNNSKDVTPNQTPIGLFRRRNSDECLSSNSKNQIKWYLSDQVTRVLFEKVYKKKLQFNLD